MRFSEKLYPGIIYHIWTHGVLDEDIFREDQNYIFFLNRYFKYTTPILKTYAFCLMPNHFHFLVKTRNIDEINTKFPEVKIYSDNEFAEYTSKRIGNLLNSYTKSFNSFYKRKGGLFNRHFKRKSIDKEEYFTKIILYIHNNPIHHGFAHRIKDWPYSSWHSYINKKDDNLYKEDVLRWFGGLDDFIKIHLDMENQQL